jgi:hypothetical protein
MEKRHIYAQLALKFNPRVTRKSYTRADYQNPPPLELTVFLLQKKILTSTQKNY